VRARCSLAPLALTLNRKRLFQENATDEQEPAIDHEAHATDEQAQDDTVMNDIGPESDIEEFSTAGASSAPMQPV
jgi:hypothetical protein